MGKDKSPLVTSLALVSTFLLLVCAFVPSLEAFSFSAGLFCICLPHWVFYRVTLGGASTCAQAKKVLHRFYWAEALKLLLFALTCSLFFMFSAVNPPWFFVAIILAQLFYWWVGISYKLVQGGGS